MPRPAVVAASARHLQPTGALTSDLVAQLRRGSARVAAARWDKKHNVFLQNPDKQPRLRQPGAIPSQPSGPKPNVTGEHWSQQRPITLGLQSQTPPSLLQVVPSEPTGLHLQAEGNTVTVVTGRRSAIVAGCEVVTDGAVVDPRRHALDEPFAHLRQRLLRAELSGQSGAAEAAEGVDVALRAEVSHRLDAWNQAHLQEGIDRRVRTRLNGPGEQRFLTESTRM